MQFKDIIGQEDVKRHLIEMYAQNRLSHALLFLGKEFYDNSHSLSVKVYLFIDFTFHGWPPILLKVDAIIYFYFKK